MKFQVKDGVKLTCIKEMVQNKRFNYIQNLENKICYNCGYKMSEHARVLDSRLKMYQDFCPTTLFLVDKEYNILLQIMQKQSEIIFKFEDEKLFI